MLEPGMRSHAEPGALDVVGLEGWRCALPDEAPVGRSGVAGEDGVMPTALGEELVRVAGLQGFAQGLPGAEELVDQLRIHNDDNLQPGFAVSVFFGESTHIVFGM